MLGQPTADEVRKLADPADALFGVEATGRLWRYVEPPKLTPRRLSKAVSPERQPDAWLDEWTSVRRQPGGVWAAYDWRVHLYVVVDVEAIEGDARRMALDGLHHELDFVRAAIVASIASFASGKRLMDPPPTLDEGGRTADFGGTHTRPAPIEKPLRVSGVDPDSGTITIVGDDE